MGELEKVATLIERAIMLNPGVGYFYDDQAQMYALLGREQEARKAYEKTLENWVVVPNLEQQMMFNPVEDRKLQDQIAEAYLKAGVQGKPSEYYKENPYPNIPI